MNTRLRRLLSLPFFLGVAVGATTVLGATKLGSSVFTDVPKGSYYDGAIGEMYQLGIIKGYGDGRFGPDDAVTRGQLAVMMQRLRDDILGGGASEGDTDTGAESSASESSAASTSRSSKSRSSSSSSSSAASVATNTVNGTLILALANMNVPESATSAKISITRIGGTKGKLTVHYGTKDGTATSGLDYTNTSGTATFAEGETSKIITISMKDDALGEGNETFTLSIDSPTGGANIGNPNTTTVTVLDNESGSASSDGGSTSSTPGAGSLGFSAAAYGVSEADGSMTVTVERQNGTSGQVTVDYATSNGTASAADYTTAKGTLTFASGESTKSFTVSVNNNSIIEGSKTVNLALSNAKGGAGLRSPTTVSLTIYDDEVTETSSGSVRFSSATYNALESAGEAIITVQRLGGTKGTVKVDYSANDGSAIGGSDYTKVNGTLTFAPGEISKTFRIPITKDIDSEGEETINLLLTNVQGATLDSQYTAVVKVAG
jgi:hypothetical protein